VAWTSCASSILQKILIFCYCRPAMILVAQRPVRKLSTCSRLKQLSPTAVKIKFSPTPTSFFLRVQKLNPFFSLHLLHSQTLTPNLSSSPLNPTQIQSNFLQFLTATSIHTLFPFNFRASRFERYVICDFYFQKEKGLSF
jgi:hypothetical protein